MAYGGVVRRVDLLVFARDVSHLPERVAPQRLDHGRSAGAAAAAAAAKFLRVAVENRKVVVVLLLHRVGREPDEVPVAQHEPVKVSAL